LRQQLAILHRKTKRSKLTKADRAALDFQPEFPGIQTNACFHFARLVAEARRKDQYDIALSSWSLACRFGPRSLQLRDQIASIECLLEEL